MKNNNRKDKNELSLEYWWASLDFLVIVGENRRVEIVIFILIKKVYEKDVGNGYY